MKIKPYIFSSLENIKIQEYLNNDDEIVARTMYFSEDLNTYLFLIEHKHLVEILKHQQVFIKIYVSLQNEEIIKYVIDGNLFNLNEKDKSMYKGRHDIRKCFDVCINDLLKGNKNDE